MYMIALLALGLTGLIALVNVGNSLVNNRSATLTNSVSTAFAQSFIKYRDEVDKLAASNISFSGTWPARTIANELPGLGSNIGFFGNYQTGNVLFTWINLNSTSGASGVGAVTTTSIASEIFKASNGSAMVGMDIGGKYVPANGTIGTGAAGSFVTSNFINKTLPQNIPVNSVVSVQTLSPNNTWTGNTTLPGVWTGTGTPPDPEWYTGTVNRNVFQPYVTDTTYWSFDGNTQNVCTTWGTEYHRVYACHYVVRGDKYRSFRTRTRVCGWENQPYRACTNNQTQYQMQQYACNTWVYSDNFSNTVDCTGTSNKYWSDSP